MAVDGQIGLRHAEENFANFEQGVPHQLTLSQLDEKTKFYRSFENTVIPGLVQTPDYARAIFARVVVMHKYPTTSTKQ